METMANYRVVRNGDLGIFSVQKRRSLFLWKWWVGAWWVDVPVGGDPKWMWNWFSQETVLFFNTDDLAFAFIKRLLDEARAREEKKGPWTEVKGDQP